MTLTLTLLPQKFAICYLDRKSPLPDWLEQEEFFSITKTDKELSIIYPQEKIPGGVLCEKDWRAFRVESIVDGIYAVGIISALAEPLAKAGISILNVSTYQTNYIFVEERNLSKAKEILSKFCKIEEL